MTYRPRPIATKDIELSNDLLELVERLAAHNHDIWAAQRIADGMERSAKNETIPRESIRISLLTQIYRIQRRFMIATPLREHASGNCGS